MAKSRRPVSARREPESGCVLFVAPGLPRLRYCCSSASMVVGKPSMTMVPRLGRPSGPMGSCTRLRNRGSRYLSNRSGGSMMCMSQSTNLSPSFMASSSLGCPLLAPRSPARHVRAEFYSGDGSSATLGAALRARALPAQSRPWGEVRKGGKAPPPSLVSPQLAVVCIGIVVAALFLADPPCVLRAPARRCRCAPRHRRFLREPGTIWSTRGEPCRWRSPLPRASPPARSRRADDPDAYRASVVQHDVPKRSAYLTPRGPKAGARTSFGTRGALHGGDPRHGYISLRGGRRLGEAAARPGVQRRRGRGGRRRPGPRVRLQSWAASHGGARPRGQLPPLLGRGRLPSRPRPPHGPRRHALAHR